MKIGAKGAQWFRNKEGTCVRMCVQTLRGKNTVTVAEGWHWGIWVETGHFFVLLVQFSCKSDTISK